MCSACEGNDLFFNDFLRNVFPIVDFQRIVAVVQFHIRFTSYGNNCTLIYQTPTITIYVRLYVYTVYKPLMDLKDSSYILLIVCLDPGEMALDTCECKCSRWPISIHFKSTTDAIIFFCLFISYYLLLVNCS